MGQPGVPLPGYTDAAVVVEPPGEGPGYWAGGPSSTLVDGIYYLAYRLRRPVGQGRGYVNVVARSADGVRFETVAVLDRDAFGAESLERPALVPLADGRWRLYVSCDIPATGGWQVEVLEADDPADFEPTRRRTLLPRADAASVKDPVILRDGDTWHMWICCHPRTGEPVTDTAYTAYATSRDGLDWSWQGAALSGRTGCWDERMARITAVFLDERSPVAYYDGRATAAENFEERTGIAFGTGPDSFVATGDTPAVVSPYGSGSLRYVSVLPLPAGGHRLYYEATRADGAHELRTEHLPPA